MESKEKWYCYILRNNDEKYKNCTYNGITNNLKRRIRQHNKEIKGGAKYTGSKNVKWEYYCIMEGFEDYSNCLQCEWRIKKPENKKRSRKYTGPIGRIKGLFHVIKNCKHKWTNNSKHDNEKNNFTIHLSQDIYDHFKKEINEIYNNYTFKILDVNTII